MLPFKSEEAELTMADLQQYFFYTMKKGDEPKEFHFWRNCPTIHQWFEQLLGSMREKEYYEITASDIRAFERDLKNGNLEQLRVKLNDQTGPRHLFKHGVAFIKTARRLLDAQYRIFYWYKTVVNNNNT